MNNSALKQNFFLAACIGLPCATFAQGAEKDLDTVTIEIVKEYTPTISDAFKKNDNPVINDTVTLEPKLNYGIKSEKMESGFELEPIGPARIKGEPLSKLYNSYIKAGAGTQNYLYGEAFVNGLRSRKHSWGLHIKHLSSKGNIKNAGYSGFGDNQVNAYGKKFINKYTLSGGLDFDYNVLHFYGFNDSLIGALDNSITGKNAIKQRYSVIGAQARLQSQFKDSVNINHDINIKYYNLIDLYGTKENNFVLFTNLNRYVNKEFLNVRIGFDYNDDWYYYKDSAFKQINTNTIVNFKPTISTAGNKYKFIVGINSFLEVERDIQGFYSFSPSVYFSYDLIKDILIPYMGIDGKLQRNNIRTLSAENPFIISDPLIANSAHTIQAYGGVKGQFSSSSSFNISVSRDKIENALFFVTDTNSVLKNRFTLVYDDVKLFNLHGEISYHFREKLAVMLMGDVNQYGMDFEVKPWHKPSYLITFSGSYNLKEKIVLRSAIVAIGSQYARNFEVDAKTVKPVKLDGTVDVNLEMEYRYTKKMSAYLKLNNLAGIRYEKWQNYPLQRFNLLLGLTYVF